MQLNDFSQLEDKVKTLVSNLKAVRDENKKLQSELEVLKNETSVNNEERLQIKEKVESLIQLIDSIEQ